MQTRLAPHLGDDKEDVLGLLDSHAVDAGDGAHAKLLHGFARLLLGAVLGLGLLGSRGLLGGLELNVSVAAIDEIRGSIVGVGVGVEALNLSHGYCLEDLLSGVGARACRKVLEREEREDMRGGGIGGDIKFLVSNDTWLSAHAKH